MGKDAARRAFGETRAMRRSGRVGYRLYLAHASIELRVNGEPEVARRVFEHGLSQHESYIAEPEYVLEYVDFLVQVTFLSLSLLFFFFNVFFFHVCVFFFSLSCSLFQLCIVCFFRTIRLSLGWLVSLIAMYYLCTEVERTQKWYVSLEGDGVHFCSSSLLVSSSIRTSCICYLTALKNLLDKPS